MENLLDILQQRVAREGDTTLFSFGDFYLFELNISFYTLMVC